MSSTIDITIGGVRIIDMPDLGAVNDTASVVGERAGSGRFAVTALRAYVGANYLPLSGGTMTGALKVLATVDTASLSVTNSAGADFILNDPSAPPDSKLYDFAHVGGTLVGRAFNDATTAANNWLVVTRTGYTINAITLAGTSIALDAANIALNGAVGLSGGLTVAAAATFNGGITAAGVATFNGGAVISNGLHVATGDVQIDQNLVVSGNTGLNGALHVGGTVELDEGVTVNNGAFVNNGLSVNSGNIDAAADIVVAGAVQIGGDGFKLVSDSTTRAIMLHPDGWNLSWNGSLNYFSNTGAPLFYSESSTGDFHIAGTLVPNTNSDTRVKRDVAPFERGLAEILKLRPITYRYNGLGGTIDTGKERVGLIAQDVLPIFPECVFETPAPPVDTTRAELRADPRFPGQLSLDDKPLLYALLNAVRELSDRLETLKRDVAARGTA